MGVDCVSDSCLHLGPFPPISRPQLAMLQGLVPSLVVSLKGHDWWKYPGRPDPFV